MSRLNTHVTSNRYHVCVQTISMVCWSYLELSLKFMKNKQCFFFFFKGHAQLFVHKLCSRNHKM